MRLNRLPNGRPAAWPAAEAEPEPGRCVREQTKWTLTTSTYRWVPVPSSANVGVKVRWMGGNEANLTSLVGKS